MKISVFRVGSYSCFCLNVYRSCYPPTGISTRPHAEEPGEETHREIIRATGHGRVPHQREFLFLAMLDRA